MAASTLSLLPVLLVYFFAQRYIVQGFARSDPRLTIRS